jgi:hypothetical protein
VLHRLIGVDQDIIPVKPVSDSVIREAENGADGSTKMPFVWKKLLNIPCKMLITFGTNLLEE